ncbi:uncharacterized protein LOC113332849 [Papaver somniferum]|uniref:uncharacterized protein LOC113332849 n=1 Tax=Papaver somniferum TaxID=3469 RepID=UPI000E6FA17B|nr:uncharacterized protein LOC113332849 [Papaver somniferum]
MKMKLMKIEIKQQQNDPAGSHNSGNVVDEEFYEIAITGDEVASDSETESTTSLSNDASAHANSCLYPNVRNSLGSMNVKCKDCGALHFMDERLTKSSPKNPLFGSCCLEGRIRLPNLKEPPQQLKELYEGTHRLARLFQRYMPRYNSCNAFTSLGCTLKPRELKGKGPLVFTIHGELRHQTSTLLPENGDRATYSQLYIYDPSDVVSKRMKDNPMLDKEVPSTEKDVYVSLQCKSDKDKRRYNLPTIDEVSVILPGDGTIKSGVRDIVLHLKGSRYLERINECHPAYLPLHYVLLFPYDELSWEPDMVRWNVELKKPTKVRLSQKDYYGYRLFPRVGEYSTILRGGMLLQEFLVDAWAATEQNRLEWMKHGQLKLHAQNYKKVYKMASSNQNPAETGLPLILPSSFTCGPRYMDEIYHDSMAITRYNHHPDIFLTMTANPNWEEIRGSLFQHQQPYERPDILARVFEMKRKALMDEIQQNKAFETTVTHVYTIEFQKRGLPHMHALIFLDTADKIHTPEKVDNIVCAEFPDEVDDPLLFETIQKCMVHGPCGSRKPDA